MAARLLVVAALAAASGLFIPYADLYIRGSRLAYSHLPIICVAILLAGAYLVGPLLARLRIRFDQRAVAFVFASLLPVVALASSGLVAYLFPVTVAARYYATEENRWQELFVRLLPDWIAPTDRAAIAYFYDGLPPGRPLPWAAWAPTLLAWSLFAALMFLAVLGFSVAVRRQWADHEKLVFPLMQVAASLLEAAPGGQAIAATGPGRAVRPELSTRAGRIMLWCTAGAVVLLHSVNGLHQYIPQVPELRLHAIPIGQALVSRPWSALQGEKIYIIPSVIGVSYLLTSEVALSFWFFHWFWALQRLVMAAIGFEGTGGTSIPAGLYGRYQEVGAFFVVAYLAAAPVVRQAARDREVAAGLAAFAVGLAGMAAWLVAAGMQPAVAAAFLLAFFVIAIVLTRAVAAAGVLFVECSFLPQDILVRGFGFKSIGAKNLAVLAFPEMIFMFEQQTILMPYAVQSLKFADEVGLNRRQVIVGTAVAFAFLLPAAYWSAMATIYSHGGRALSQWYFVSGAMWPFKRLQNTIVNQVARDWAAIGCAVAGATLMGAMTWLQRSFTWWPIHPLGYTMGSTFTMGVMWFPIFLGWLIKLAVEKYGGFKAYRQLRPLFVGLVVGDFLAALIWLAIDAAAGTIGHNVFPGF